MLGSCWIRVVEYIDDLVEIADDEGSEGSLLSGSSSLGTSLPELEDQENIPQFNRENMNTIPILPPYVVSGQHAIHSKGVPKSAFHPYCHPLGLLECPKVGAGRFTDRPLSWGVTSTGSSYSQEVTEWSIVGQMAKINADHLEEGEVSHCLHQMEEIMVPQERRVLSPHSTRPTELEQDSSEDSSS